MRITLTLPELEEGRSIQAGPKDRILDLSMLAHRREPVAIYPMDNHDHKIISIVLLTEDAVDRIGRGTSAEIKFRPVWCKAFTLCSSTKDTLLALICEFENGQFWIDKEGHKKCKLTLNGDGTDPKAVYNSHFVLADLLAAPERPIIVSHAIEFIQRNF